MRRPAILVPYPLATGGHQSFNAAVIVRLNVGLCVEQRNLDVPKLVTLLEQVTAPGGNLSAWKKNFETVQNDAFLAADRIVEMVVKLG